MNFASERLYECSSVNEITSDMIIGTAVKHKKPMNGGEAIAVAITLRRKIFFRRDFFSAAVRT